MSLRTAFLCRHTGHAAHGRCAGLWGLVWPPRGRATHRPSGGGRWAQGFSPPQQEVKKINGRVCKLAPVLPRTSSNSNNERPPPIVTRVCSTRGHRRPSHSRRPISSWQQDTVTTALKEPKDEASATLFPDVPGDTPGDPEAEGPEMGRARTALRPHRVLLRGRWAQEGQSQRNRPGDRSTRTGAVKVEGGPRGSWRLRAARGRDPAEGAALPTPSPEPWRWQTATSDRL